MLIELTEGWRLRAVGGAVPSHVAGAVTVAPLPARVPGCVHLDLLAAGVIDDPYLDRNEAEVAWVGRVDWCYETSFDCAGAADDDELDLMALGLDTVATVRVNDLVVGQTANMHRSYRFPVRSLVRPGRNSVSVTFAAPVDAAAKASEEIGPRPCWAPTPSTRSARWPATMAGTGDRSCRRWGSGDR